MKVLVTGVKGQLGHDVVNELEKRGHTAVGVDIEEMDITDFASVEKTLTAVSPEAVIHCAAWTAVDAAEDAEEDDPAQVHAQQKSILSTLSVRKISLKCVNIWILPACIFQPTMYLTVRELTAGNRTVRTMHR